MIYKSSYTYLICLINNPMPKKHQKCSNRHLYVLKRFRIIYIKIEKIHFKKLNIYL